MNPLKVKRTAVKKSLVILPVLVLVIVILVSVFIIYPWFKEVSRMKQEMADNESLLGERLIPKIQLLESLDPKTVDQNVSFLEKVVPSFPQEWSVLTVLEVLAAEAGVTLESVRVAGVQEKGEAGFVSIPIAIEGSVSEVLAFLKNMEKAKRVISLTSFNWQVDEEKANLSSTLSAPFWPVPDSLGPVESPLEKLTVSEQEVMARAAGLNLYGEAFVESQELDKLNVGRQDPF